MELDDRDKMSRRENDRERARLKRNVQAERDENEAFGNEIPGSEGRWRSNSERLTVSDCRVCLWS